MADERAAPAAGGSARARAWLPLALSVALIAVFGVTLWKIGHNTLDIREIRSPLIGRPAPSFDLPSLDDRGARVTSAEFAGRPYVVNVWGTWCPECRAEHGSLLALARLSGVPIVGIDWKDTRADARRWLAELGNPYARVGADDDGRVAIDFGVYGAPETFLIGADGRVLYKQIGALSVADWSAHFAPLLGARAGSAP